MRIVARKVFAKPGRRRMKIRAAEVLVGGFFADGGLHQRRTGQEDFGLVFYEDDIVREAREISTARGR